MTVSGDTLNCGEVLILTVNDDTLEVWGSSALAISG